MNASSDFSCLNGDLSRNSITLEQWQMHETIQDGAPAIAAVMILFLLVAFTSNAFILVSMLWQGLLHQPAHILLFNLAITDLLVSITIMPFTITSGITREFVFGESDYVRCKVCQTGMIFTVLSSVSLHTLALLSLDRFLFIFLPFHYKKLVTAKRVAVTLLAVWVLCIVLSVPPLFGFGEIKFATSVGNCFVSFFGETHLTKNIYYILLILLEALIPVIVLIVTNVWLLCLMRRHFAHVLRARKSLTAAEKAERRKSIREKVYKQHNHQQLQLLRVFGAVFLSNFITWLPALALALAAMVVDFDTVPAGVIAFVYLTYISHSVFHPLIEACFIFQLRDILTRCFTCGLKWLRPPQERRKGGFRQSTDRQLSSQRRDSEENGSLKQGSIKNDLSSGKKKRFRPRVSCGCMDTCCALFLPDSAGKEEVEGTTATGITGDCADHSGHLLDCSVQSNAPVSSSTV